MKPMIRSLALIAALTCIPAATGAASAPAPAPAAKATLKKVLVYTKAAGFVHSSIPAAAAALQKLGAQNGFGVDVTADPNAFSTQNLAQYQVVIFDSTTGDVLPGAAQRAAFEAFIASGGGWLGIHAASDMGSARTSWPYYLALVGSSFKGHVTPEVWAAEPFPGTTYGGKYEDAPPEAEEGQQTFPLKYTSWPTARVIVEDPSSAILPGWSAVEMRGDEWYGFRENPRPNVHVLASIDENSYEPAGGAMGKNFGDHPIIWCQNYKGGRSVYTALGHRIALWTEPKFLNHVLGAIQVAAGVAPADKSNCVTHREVRELIAKGGLTPEAAANATNLVNSAYTKYATLTPAGYTASLADIDALRTLARNTASGDAAARTALLTKAQELNDWMQVLIKAPAR